MAAMPERIARPEKPAWRQQAEAFWHWWTAQLAREVPASLGGMGSQSAPVVAIRGETLALLEARGNSVVEIAQAPLASLDLEGRRIALRGLLTRSGGDGARARLCLDREDSLLRRTTLPLATEENLAQVLGFEMDRLTPFRPEDIYFDFRVASRDTAAGRIQVDLGAARRDLVDERLARLREYGVEVTGVVLADDAARWSSPLNLLPAGQPGDRDRLRDRNIQMIAAGTVLALLLIALVLPLWQKRSAVIAMQPLVTKARADAEATDALSRELDKLVADYNFLLTKKHSAQPVLALVEELTRLLPDTTWVQQLDVRHAGKVREVQLSGETPSSAKLIEIFEQSQILQNAAPRGSITKGQTAGTERFLIAAEVRPRTPPEAIPLSVAATMPAVPLPPPIEPPKAVAPPAAAAPATPPATATVTPTPGKAAAAAPQPAQQPAPAQPAPAPAAPASAPPPAPSGSQSGFGPLPSPPKKAGP